MKKSRKSLYWREMWDISWGETKSCLGIKGLFVQNTLIILVLIITAIQWKGKVITLENIWSGYRPNIVGLLILFVVAPIVAFVKLFWIIPREYRKKQKEIKRLEDKLTSEVIDINILLIPVPLDADSVSAILKVKNKEVSKKIIGCRAKLTNLFITCDNKGSILDFTDSITAIEYPFFYWQENHDKQTDIEHSDEKILCIAKANEDKSLNLAVLNHEHNFPAKIISDSKRMYEIRFKIELSGNVGNKGQVFYKTFCGKVVYTVNTINETGKNIFVDDIDFYEISEKDLVESYK